MKTTALQFVSLGNLGLVQIRVEPESQFLFKPGGPEIRSGNLIISESTSNGNVGKLMAINNCNSYLLLTDADLLIGAKQNRVLNESILLAPNSKTFLDVSCVERLRWHYTEQNFSNPDIAADPELRKIKALSKDQILNNSENYDSNIQNDVWSHIQYSFLGKNFSDKTESYHELASFSRKKNSNSLPEIHPENGCNGLASIIDNKITSIDIFGTEDSYQYYFPMLRDSSLRLVKTGDGVKSIDIHEANYRVLELVDNYHITDKKPELAYHGAGILCGYSSDQMTGFELSLDGQLVHSAIFPK